MKKFVLLMFFVLATTMISNAQSMLCTYKGGYFIQNGNTWYEYRPQDKDGVWATYTQYSIDNNYYYIKNSDNSLSIPKQSHNNIYILRGSSKKWEVVYTTIKTYKYCPVRSNQIFTFDNGFFVKNGNTWKLYLPEKKSNASWADFTQYKQDDKFYYIKNSSDDIAVPRNQNNNFFWYKNSKWETLYKTLAIYDGKSGNKNTVPVQNYANKNNNVNNSKVQPQQVQRKVVKKWRESRMNGYADCIQYNDGWYVEDSYTRCISCSGTGRTLQTIYGPIGYYKCELCKGSGIDHFKREGWRIDEHYSDGNSGFSFHYHSNSSVIADIHQGTKKIVSYTSQPKLIDAGDYWKFGPAKISKDLQILIYNNRTYRKCSEQEYQRLYGEEIRKSKEINNETVRMTGGGVGTSSNQSSGTGIQYVEKPCYNCNGTGFVLDYTFSCPHPSYVDCRSKSCQQCGGYHCEQRTAHKYCDVCKGTKTIKRLP